jgi:alkanesulfonate monooxygenase SsuD/methylene tetrahydromethanopterin reductase-like flavin-dependent oxidoreductase (luciferase family)
MRETKYGLNLPYCTDVAAQAQRIERLGFDYITVGEHVSFHTPVPSALITLAYAAAVTTRVRLMSGILSLPLYPAAVVAKMTAALDVLSGGRFELGIGVGGENPAEFAACGVPVTERGKRADEALEVIRQLWTGKKVTYEGRFCTLTDVDIAPPPAQPGGPPIWISGRGGA